MDLSYRCVRACVGGCARPHAHWHVRSYEWIESMDCLVERSTDVYVRRSCMCMRDGPWLCMRGGPGSVEVGLGGGAASKGYNGLGRLIGFEAGLEAASKLTMGNILSYRYCSFQACCGPARGWTRSGHSRVDSRLSAARFRLWQDGQQPSQRIRGRCTALHLVPSWWCMPQ